MQHQKNLRLGVDNRGSLRKTPSERLFADLLKRQARKVMRDLTECPPDTIPAHLATLEALQDVIQFACQNGLLMEADTRLSGKQLMYPATVADFAACLVITRKQHRAPAFVNGDNAQLDRIEKKLDTLAGAIAHDPELLEMLFSEQRHVRSLADRMEDGQ